MYPECGIGSTKGNTESLRKFIYEVINDFDIKTVNDAGCGDLYWFTLEDYPVSYTGYDEVIRDSAVSRLRENWILVEADIMETCLCESDLVICKDVLRHHDRSGIDAIIENINTAKYLLADYDDKTVIGDSWHKTVSDGENYSLRGNKVDLREWLGDPIRSVASDEIETKRYGLWRL